MKTFDEKDLFTWSNRHEAKIGTKGYFADSITDLHSNINAGYVHELMSIFNKNNRCFSNGTFSYGFFLPVDAVKEEKKYRACKSIQEFYGLVFNCKRATKDSFCINGLIGTVIHFRFKGIETSYYECITGIVVYINGDIAVHIDGCNFELLELFNDYEIEINGEWKPFGVINED